MTSKTPSTFEERENHGRRILRDITPEDIFETGLRRPLVRRGDGGVPETLGLADVFNWLACPAWTLEEAACLSIGCVPWPDGELLRWAEQHYEEFQGAQEIADRFDHLRRSNLVGGVPAAGDPDTMLTAIGEGAQRRIYVLLRESKPAYKSADAERIDALIGERDEQAQVIAALRLALDQEVARTAAFERDLIRGDQLSKKDLRKTVAAIVVGCKKYGTLESWATGADRKNVEHGRLDLLKQDIDNVAEGIRSAKQLSEIVRAGLQAIERDHGLTQD